MRLTDTQGAWLSDFQEDKENLPSDLRTLIIQSFQEKPKQTCVFIMPLARCRESGTPVSGRGRYQQPDGRLSYMVPTVFTPMGS